MILYNYNKTKAVFIPPNSLVSIECKFTPRGPLNFTPSWYRGVIALLINNSFLYSKSLIHDENDSDRTNALNYYTKDEELQEIEKCKALVRVIMKKLKEGDHSNDEYYISEDGYLKVLE